MSAIGIEAADEAVKRAVRQFRADDVQAYRAFLQDTASALSVYPPDLVAQACRHVIEHHRYPTMPTTADFLEPIRDEKGRRQLLLAKLEVAKRKADREASSRPFVGDRSLTPEQQAKIDAIKAGALRGREMPMQPEPVRGSADLRKVREMTAAKRAEKLAAAG